MPDDEVPTTRGDFRIMYRLRGRGPDEPIPQPPKAEEVLDALAARYPAGSTVSLAEIAFTAGVNEAVAGQVRRWAKAEGRWPWEDGKGGGRPTLLGRGR